MSTQRAHIVLPADLLKQIDELVGPRGRSAFLVETAQAELRRRRLAVWFADPTPAWKDEDHPELKNGSAAWVRKLRREWDRRPTETPTAVQKRKSVAAAAPPKGKKPATSRTARTV